MPPLGSNVGGRVWGGTNVRFGVSQQTTIPVYVRDKNEPIGTHTHRVIVLRGRSMTRIGLVQNVAEL